MKKLLTLILGVTISFFLNAQNITLEKNNAGAWIKEDGEKVLFYQARTKSMDGEYARANYFHPLYNVDGYEMTEDFPKDHLHHRGIFWTWHQTTIGEKHIGDAWECKEFIWDVIEFGTIKSNENSLTMQAKTLWKSPSWTDNNGILKPFMKEIAEVTIHKKNMNFRIIDFEISLLALEENVKIGGSDNAKGYGGFSVRMKMPKDIKFEAAAGEVVPITNQIDAGSWMNISGSLAANGREGGVIIINHPENPMYPEKWILRKKGSMQNPVYPGRQPVLLSSKNPTILKYRLVIYVGEMQNNQLEKLSVWN